jgi:hypothetical protein
LHLLSLELLYHNTLDQRHNIVSPSNEDATSEIW